MLMQYGLFCHIVCEVYRNKQLAYINLNYLLNASKETSLKSYISIFSISVVMNVC